MEFHVARGCRAQRKTISEDLLMNNTHLHGMTGTVPASGAMAADGRPEVMRWMAERTPAIKKTPDVEEET